MGREIPLPSTSASAAPSRKPPAASITISRSVSPMVASEPASSRCWSDNRSAFIAPEPLTIAAAESAIAAVSCSMVLAFSTSLVRAWRYSASRPAISWSAWTIFGSREEIACSEFSTNLSRAIALLATAWSELITKVATSAVTVWNWVATFLAPKSIADISASSALLGRSSSL